MLRKDLEAKKRQHYVWAKYLARWGRGTMNVFYTTKTGKFAHDSVRGIAVDDYFYKITVLNSKHIEVIKGFSRNSPDHLQQHHMSYLHDFLRIQQVEFIYGKSGTQNLQIEQYLQALKCNQLENLHAAHEKMALPVLAALAEEKLDVLQNQRHMLEFMTFFGHQICRTKTFRDGVMRVLSRQSALEIEVANAMQHTWWFLSYMYGMNMGFSLYIGRQNARHALLINDTSVPFITSDQPIVNVHSCVSDKKFTPPEYADLYYPITPRVAYIICDSERFPSGRHEVDKATVVEFNSKVAAQAMVYIIGDTVDAIRPFRKYIGQNYQSAPDGRVKT
ncbi:DUF4238 domain-containing protein [Janthinobacterium sp. HH104]|uniref:DUF4238 domain-containing protein n=1 Tax=Janthinobacterium sp. HH104 TaxID=1537276 RepID=UPI0008756DDC|nr:DUF4238 domain-containing protein [Janthinobacterium sp. HH104]